MIAIFIALLLMLSAVPAFGQFGGSIVSDPPTEQATAQTASELNQANAELQQDIKANSLTAASVTTTGDSGLFQSVSAFLDSLDGNFNGGINSGQIFSAIFPGWVPLPADSIPQVANITTKTLATYSAALNAAQSQAASFDAEESHLGSIESANLGAAACCKPCRSIPRHNLRWRSKFNCYVNLKFHTSHSMRPRRERNSMNGRGPQRPVRKPPIWECRRNEYQINSISVVISRNRVQSSLLLGNQ